jgi:hypothetical protein
MPRPLSKFDLDPFGSREREDRAGDVDGSGLIEADPPHLLAEVHDDDAVRVFANGNCEPAFVFGVELAAWKIAGWAELDFFMSSSLAGPRYADHRECPENDRGAYIVRCAKICDMTVTALLRDALNHSSGKSIFHFIRRCSRRASDRKALARSPRRKAFDRNVFARSHDSASSTRSRATPLSISRKLLLLPVLIPRRDGPQRLVQGYIQVIDGLRNRASVGISHHVPGIIYEVQVRAAEYFV